MPVIDNTIVINMILSSKIMFGTWYHDMS